VSLVRKGAITRRGGLPTFKPTGLAPQKIAESYSNWATGDIHQSKVVYNGEYFFVLYWEGDTTHLVKYGASSNGIEWTTTTLYNLTDAYTLTPWAGNIDVRIKNISALYATFTYTAISPDEGRPRARRLDIVDSTLTSNALWFLEYAGNKITTSKACYNLDGHLYTLVHGSTNTYLVYSPDPWAIGTRYDYSNVPAFSATSGGVQLLNYKTSSPYDMLALIKQGTDDILYYSVLHQDTLSLDTPMTSLGVTLATGFSSFCAVSEAETIGDPERVHLVYIKSSGELCYIKFENDAFGSEKVLVVSGASYPIIACGSDGKLYVLYVKDGKIWVIHYKGRWFSPVKLFPEHSYNNPTYLSSNQNVQNGFICLVWTEGTESPYEVWFCYLED